MLRMSTLKRQKTRTDRLRVEQFETLFKYVQMVKAVPEVLGWKNFWKMFKSGTKRAKFDLEYCKVYFGVSLPCTISRKLISNIASSSAISVSNSAWWAYQINKLWWSAVYNYVCLCLKTSVTQIVNAAHRDLWACVQTPTTEHWSQSDLLYCSKSPT